MLPLKGFRVFDYSSSSSPKLAWRNGRNRRGLADTVEISVDGATRIASLGLSGIADRIRPEDAGLLAFPLEELRGGDPAYNAAALRRLLEGEDGAYRNAVLLNSAGALIVAGEAPGWHDGAEMAAEVIDSKRAAALLDRWIEACK